MPTNRLNSATTTLALLLLPSVAFAHTGLGDTGGLAHGFAHPASGLDHVLAMVMVGLFAAQLGGRALWLLPAAFVGLMAAGGALGIAGLGLPFVEAGIALSVAALGAAVAFKLRAPLAATMGAVGLFALFHGHAHGAEMPAGADGLLYAAGFVAATALLHLAGIAIGLLLGRTADRRGEAVVRASGALACLAGIFLLFASH